MAEIPDFIHQFLAHLPYYTLLLDPNRKVIASNDRFVMEHELPDSSELFGMKPGDVFQCENAREAGCGNSSNCRFCGIFKTLAECNEKKIPVSNDCRLMVNKNGFVHAYEFTVRCSPIVVGGDLCYFLTLTDVSAENRKNNLERIFFHDVLNTINGLKGIVLLLEENRGTEEMMQQIQSLSVITERLCETISAQRDLMYAEKRELAVLTKRVSAREIIESVIESSVFQGHIQRGQVQKHLLSEDFELETDPVLLSRVLVNMVKNAMEAPNTKPEILIGSARPNEHALFYVHNHSYIGEPAARYIFQPMRSTKGKYRGLGTYSMRLIGENFLGGKVGFKTIPEEGTTFFIELPFHFNQSYRDSLYLK